MACAADLGSGQQLVVRNTFLELFDEAPIPERRPRVASDLTDLRLPQQVQYQHSSDSKPAAVLDGGLPTTKSPAMSPSLTPLLTVSEEHCQTPKPLSLPPSSAASAPGYQAYTQTPWTLPMGMPMGLGVTGMMGPPDVFPGVQPMMPPPGSEVPFHQSHPSSWGYSSTYQATTSSGAPFSLSPGPLASSTMQACSSTTPSGPVRVSGPPPFALPVPMGATTPMTRPEAAPTAELNGLGLDYVPQGNPTTVMLRNIPNRYTQGHLINLLDEQGFRSRYDFVYLPMDFRNGVNLGYAFVNLSTNKDALHAMHVFHGFIRWFYESSKVCEVSWAHPHQGLEEHVERYRNSPVMHQCMPEEYKPMLFNNGVRIVFPPPTKAIKAPKLRPVREKTFEIS